MYLFRVVAPYVFPPEECRYFLSFEEAMKEYQDKLREMERGIGDDPVKVAEQAPVRLQRVYIPQRGMTMRELAKNALNQVILVREVQTWNGQYFEFETGAT